MNIYSQQTGWGGGFADFRPLVVQNMLTNYNHGAFTSQATFTDCVSLDTNNIPGNRGSKPPNKITPT